MKIYTKTGDQGETGLYRGTRISKASPRIEAIGQVDELNAWFGYILSEPCAEEVNNIIIRVQDELFCLGAQLASINPAQSKTDYLSEKNIQQFEQEIDHFEASLPAMTAFILPGGTAAAARLHIARTICRRAERKLVELHSTQQDPSLELAMMYLNRLSDLLFVMTRFINQQAGVSETQWHAPVSEKE